MKKIFYAFFITSSVILVSCESSADSEQSAREADSLRMVAIADSINRARGMDIPDRNIGADSGDDLSVEGITRGMTEGLNQVQEGLDKMKKVTKVSTDRAKDISDAVNKTKDAVNKTVEEARKTLNGE